MTKRDHKKPRIEDQEFVDDVHESLERTELVRVFAVDRTFADVSFKQAVLNGCYFRNCKFIRCDFTGTQIKECNFKGARFESCQFRYTTWEKTLLDEEFLDYCLPPEDNLARDLVRSLRVNYGQIGNHEAVNKAAAIEVRLTGLHYFNAAYSRQGYYRSLEKYKGVNRLNFIWLHARWKALELLWGNGESILRVVIAGALLIAIVAIGTTISSPNLSYAEAATSSFLAFWGLPTSGLPLASTTALTIGRYILVGLFMAILIKRLSRR